MEKPADPERIKFRIPIIYYVIIVALIIIALWIIIIQLGFITVNNLLLNFYGFISMVVIVSMLAVLGAVFMGMFISHRILATRGFTPFEREMLEMREDITRLHEKIDKMERSNAGNPGKKIK
jgi:hypothetical protein